ncbi:MAG: secondary thiamine-phosphate synthase enzyme YjbQ [Myxococcota bacterium]|nr:secondary thiamine-phosphate synthase enzyme YjbQ [Myxococcota bacterium]
MDLFQTQLTLPAMSQGFREITREVAAIVQEAGFEQGLCHIFIHHTSASLLIQENADPDVQRDLQAFFARLVPEGDPLYIHTAEGPDDMPAHVRSALTATSLTVPLTAGRLGLGTWQGIYVWEHRTRARSRRLTVTLQGINGRS